MNKLKALNKRWPPSFCVECGTWAREIAYTRFAVNMTGFGWLLATPHSTYLLPATTPEWSSSSWRESDRRMLLLATSSTTSRYLIISHYRVNTYKVEILFMILYIVHWIGLFAGSSCMKQICNTVVVWKRFGEMLLNSSRCKYALLQHL